MSQFPRERTIIGADGLPRSATYSPCRKIQTFVPGGVCPPCQQVCECLNQPGCVDGGNSANGPPRRIRGRYVWDEVNGQPSWVYDEFTATRCCCGHFLTRSAYKRTIIQRWCEDGTLSTFIDRTETVEPPGIHAIRHRETQVQCLTGQVTVNNFNESGTGVGCGPAGWGGSNSPLYQLGGWGYEEPLWHRNSQWGGVVSARSVSGWFRGDCMAHEAVMDTRGAGIPGGAAPVRALVKHVQYLHPNNLHCLPSAECLRACCLPGTPAPTCTHVTPAQCLALGGQVQAPGVSCFESQCYLSGSGRGACCDPATGGCSYTLPGDCLSPLVFHGIGTTCEGGQRPVCPQPTGRCCVPAGGGGYNCVGGQTPAQCTALNGLWGVAGSTCQSHPCPGPGGGACCLPEGGCTQVGSPQGCTALNGIFFAGLACGSVQCTGSCCTMGLCSMVTPQQCAAGGGSFVGGLSCDPDPCGVPGACCCNTSHGLSCTVTTQASCLGGPCFWLGAGTSCAGNPCSGTTEAPRLPAGAFARAFWNGWGRGSGLVLPDGTPVGSRGRIVVPGGGGGGVGGGVGCSGCGSEMAGVRF